MTKIETIRTKVRNLNGVKFTLSDIGIKNGDLEYFGLRDLVSNKEVIVEGKSHDAVYHATELLKKVKPKSRLTIPEKKEAEKEVLIGWRCVSPYLFKAPSKNSVYSIY